MSTRDIINERLSCRDVITAVFRRGNSTLHLPINNKGNKSIIYFEELNDLTCLTVLFLLF